MIKLTPTFAWTISVVAITYIILMVLQTTDAVVVDGRISGPRALNDQKKEEESIDSYNTKTCGLSDPNLNKSEFVNNAHPGEFPWLVSFQVKRPIDRELVHFCMGSFISDKWILSAAHCFADPKLLKYIEKDWVRVRAGSIYKNDPTNLNVTIKRIFYHKHFDRNSPVGFDISLIELKEKVRFTRKYQKYVPFVNAVCLPMQGKVYPEGQAVKLAGWGDSVSKDPLSKPDQLLMTDLTLTNGQKCADIFAVNMKKVAAQFRDYRDFICADYHNGQRDACQGDSGGPLLEYAERKAVAIGIVSYGLGCASKFAPGVYTRTSTFLPWIKEITQQNINATVDHIVIDTEKIKAKI